MRRWEEASCDGRILKQSQSPDRDAVRRDEHANSDSRGIFEPRKRRVAQELEQTVRARNRKRSVSLELYLIEHVTYGKLGMKNLPTIT